MFAAGLHRYTVLVSACTFLLVLAGAAVVSSEGQMAAVAAKAPSGLTDLHQLMGAVCGVLAVFLMTWLQRAHEPNWLKMMALFLLVLIGVEGAAGMLGFTGAVTGLVAIPHALMAHVYFSLTVLVAVFTSRTWKESPARIPDVGFPSLRSMAWITPLVILVQIALGAAYRHKAMGLVPHVSWAFAAAVVAMMGATFVLVHDQKQKAMRRAAVWLLSLTLVQILVGVAAYFTRAGLEENPGLRDWMMAATVAHAGLGSAVLAASLTVGAFTLKHVVPSRGGTEASGHQLAGSGRSS